MRGLVWTGELEVRDDLAVQDPGPGEVLVRIHHAGLCHSDVSVLNGNIPYPTPVVLGHEGAGVIEAVGDDVTSVQPGDHVVLTTLGNCGHCDACDRGEATHCRQSYGSMAQRFTVGGDPAYQFANAGVFSERTVVAASQAIKIDASVPLATASLIGCAIVTGAGAVFNRAKVQPGQSVVVIGAGGIGQAVIQAARLSNASRIIVVDANPAKRDIAIKFGATEFIDASSTDDTVAAVRDLGFPMGVDHTFECVGHPTLISTAIELLDWGGKCTLLGVPKLGTEASFVVNALYQNKSILGCRYGATRPYHDIPMYIQMYLSGKLLLDEMVSQTYDLGDVQTALDDLEAGKLNRGVLNLI